MFFYFTFMRDTAMLKVFKKNFIAYCHDPYEADDSYPQYYIACIVYAGRGVYLSIA